MNRTVKITIVDSKTNQPIVFDAVAMTEYIGTLLHRVLKQLERSTELAEWELAHNGVKLSVNSTIGQIVADGDSGEITLVLRKTKSEVIEEVGKEIVVDQSETTALDLPADESSSEIVALGDGGDSEFELSLDDSAVNDLDDVDEHIALEDSDFDVPQMQMPDSSDESQAIALDEENAADVATAKPRASTAPEKRTATRRATVRYYNRMNPMRVYRFMVTITKDMVERMTTKQTDQTTSKPFRVDLDSAIEVEPVLPGCTCYPPRIATRLSGAETTLKFHVVPLVVGQIGGAKVTIRQNHATLSEVDLKVKVVQRTWFYFSSLLAICLPLLSPYMQYFFDSQLDGGGDPYLKLTEIVLSLFSPTVLFLLLGFLALGFYWITKPREAELSWEVRTYGPAEKLAEITQYSDRNRANRELVNLLRAYPNYQPALSLYAERHFQNGNMKAALSGFEKAFKQGKCSAMDYHRAALAASKLGDNAKALAILEHAVATLDASEIFGALMFNLACYRIRMKKYDAAINALESAIDKGYRKRESYVNDTDLNPVRDRADFQNVLRRLGNGNNGR